jgi:class 3 adenylate cyclase
MGGVDVRSKRPAAELKALRAAKRAEDRQKSDIRRIAQKERELERHTRRAGSALGRELGDVGRSVRREVRDTIRSRILEELEEADRREGRPAARPARPVRPARPASSHQHVPTTEEDAAAVRRRLKRNGRPEGTVTIMFTDIEDSTAIIERLGDVDASVLVKEHNDLVREQVAAHGGYEVKFRGDGFMLAFTSAAKSVRCAIAIQESMREFSERHAEAPFGICIGINSGEAVPDGADFLGTAVNIAARLADSASGGEVLVTSVVRDLVASSGEFKFLPETQIELKGISEPQRTCLVSW